MLNKIIPGTFAYVDSLTTRALSPFDSIEDLWKIMFHTFPQDTKPPLVIGAYKDEKISTSDKDDNLEQGVQIQMAVAGYKSNQLKVYANGNTLIIEGDNTSSDNVPEKFQNSFKRLFPCKDTVDLEKTSVDLLDGILTVRVPFHQPKEVIKTFF